MLQLESLGGLYYMKNTLALAVAGGKRFADILEKLPQALASQATKGTHHFGEVVVVKQNGEPSPDQRVATPHLWEGALFYLTAVASQNPEALLRYEEVLPPSRGLFPGREHPRGGRKP